MRFSATSKTIASARSIVSVTSSGWSYAHLGDLARHRDEPPQQRELADDPGVVPGVRRRRRRRLDLEQRALAAERLEQAGAAQLLGHGDRVDRLALLVQRPDRVEDVAVGRLVEVGGVDPGLDRGGDRVAREEHRAEQRLLGLEVVGRDASGRDRAHHAHSTGPRRPLPDPCDSPGHRHTSALWGGSGQPPVTCVNCLGTEGPVRQQGCGHPRVESDRSV